MAIPREEGFNRDPEAVARCIQVVNLCGRKIVVVLDKDKRLNPSLPSFRENETEINGFLLPRGCASHFPVPPWNYHVTVKQFVITENGTKKWLSRIGFQLKDLVNKVITFDIGSADGLITSSITTANINHFTVFTNYTENRIQVSVTKSRTAYAQSQEEIAAQKISRKPDKGGQPVQVFDICAYASWHVKLPCRLWTVRGLQPTDVSVGVGEEQVFHEVDDVPDKNNYGLLTETNARAGQVVVFLADISRNGGVIAVAYPAGQLKPVDGDIVDVGPVES